MILLLTGPIRSYKTTSLMDWSNGRSDCGGVLSPDVHGYRRLYNVKEKSSIPWQLPDDMNASGQMIGRFRFDPGAFTLAESWLENHLQDPKLKYLLLDEIGPLELSGQGWDPWLKKASPVSPEKTFILVVREQILDAVISRYSFEDYQVVSKEYFTDKIN